MIVCATTLSILVEGKVGRVERIPEWSNRVIRCFSVIDTATDVPRTVHFIDWKGRGQAWMERAG